MMLSIFSTCTDDYYTHVLLLLILLQLSVVLLILLLLLYCIFKCGHVNMVLVVTIVVGAHRWLRLVCVTAAEKVGRRTSRTKPGAGGIR